MRHPSLQSELQTEGAELGSDSDPAQVLGFKGTEDGVRARSGVRDQSSHARLAISGADRVEFVNRMCSNDVTLVSDVRAQTAALTTNKGRVLDHVTISSRGDNLVISGSHDQGARLKEWLEKFVVMEDCSVENLSASECNLLIFGEPSTASLREVLGSGPTPGAEGRQSGSGEFEGATAWWAEVAAPGGGGVEIQTAAQHSGALFRRLLDAGLRPVGERAFDVLRIEAGLPILGREFGDHANPLESGLRDSVSFTKGCYIGQEVVARLQNYKKVRRNLVGLKFSEEVDPEGLKEIFVDLLRVGNVTSATRSTRLGATLALGLAKPEYAKLGAEVLAVFQGEQIPGTVTELPFS